MSCRVSGEDSEQSLALCIKSITFNWFYKINFWSGKTAWRFKSILFLLHLLILHHLTVASLFCIFINCLISFEGSLFPRTFQRSFCIESDGSVPSLILQKASWSPSRDLGVCLRYIPLLPVFFSVPKISFATSFWMVEDFFWHFDLIALRICSWCYLSSTSIS